MGKISKLPVINKKIVFLFVLLSILLFSVLYIKNPVYKSSSVYIFPEKTLENHKVYYAINNGYNNSLTHDIKDDSEYHIISAQKLNTIKITCSDNTCNKTIEYTKDKIFNIDGDLISIDTGTEIILKKLKSKNMKLLVFKTKTGFFIGISSIQLQYNDELLQRSVAAIFPFYAGYTYNDDVIVERAVEDRKNYNLEYEQKYVPEQFIHNNVNKYILENFKRATTGYPYIYRLILISMLLALFIVTIPKSIYNIYKKANNEDRFFILLMGIFYTIIAYIFRHSLYFFYDGVLNSVLYLNYNDPIFSNGYLFSETFFYLIGYGSRSFFMMFFLAMICWQYKKILDIAIVGKKKLILLLPVVLSPQLIPFAVNSKRIYIASLFVMAGYLLYFRYKQEKNKYHMFATILCLVFAAVLRIDYSVFILPVLILEWLPKITFRRTIYFVFTGLMLLTFIAVTHVKRQEYQWYNYQMGKTYLLSPVLKNNPNYFNEQEKKIIKAVFPAGVEKIINGSTKYGEVSYIKILKKEDKAAFNQLVRKTIMSNLQQILKSRLKEAQSLTRRVKIYIDLFEYVDKSSNIIADLPYKTILLKYSADFMEKIQRATAPASLVIYILMFIGGCLSVFKKFRCSGFFNIGMLLCLLVTFLFTTGFYPLYGTPFLFWLFFYPGLFICELNKAKSDNVL